MMTNAYQHLLAAADFSPSTEIMMQRAVDIANRYGARLSVIQRS